MLFKALLVTIASVAALRHTTGSKAVAATCGYKCLAQKDCSQMSIEAFHTCVSNQCQQDDESVVNAIEEFIAGCKSFSANKLENGAALAMDSMKDLYITSQMAIIKRQAVAAASSGNSSNSTNGTTSGSTGTTGGAASTATGITATCTDLADVLSGVCLRSAASKSTAGLAVLAGVMGLAAML